MAKKDFKDFFPNPEEKLGYLFWQINMLWVRKVNQSLQEIGLTHTQLITLAATEWLNHKKEYVIQRDLAEKIKIDRMMISKLVSKLVDAELLTKTKSEEDSRVTLLSLSDSGRELLMDAVSIMKRNEREFFGLVEEDVPDLRLKLKNLLMKAEEHMNVDKI
ncbi:MAG: MarR family winged helix-turn-helix transcriptional regulator [Balneolaceae bacterium]